MEQVIYLIKIGELTLKGGNRKQFEKRLVQNVQLYLENVKSRTTLRAGRMYIEGPESSAIAIEFTLNHLIGITGWAKAYICEKNIEDIKKLSFQLAKDAEKNGSKSFKIDVRRAEKTFPLNSYEIAVACANDIYETGLLRVDLHKPDIKISIEIREKCYIFTNQQKGNRGLPVGTSERGLLLLSGGIDSPVAGYRMIRRGMKVDCIYFHAYPYTSAEAQKKVEDLALILARYSIVTHINIIPFTEVQMRIKERSPEDYSTLLLRMCMIKVANLLASHINAACLITGESLGQVASQTIQNMNVTESVSDYPLFRPLIGLDKEEIIATAIDIGSYETSILPYEDCCVLFSPKYPVLKAPVDYAQKLFNKLEIEELLQQAYEKREVKKICVRDEINDE
ncbi:MAG: tRNA uracil 4-sulfurtransferase ThiI [Treponemataceae bacterium]